MNKEEIKLLNEMKENCLNGAKYIDPKAMKKYNLLRSIEDRMNNWDTLKKILRKELSNAGTGLLDKFIGLDRVLQIMQTLEGSGVDE